MIITEPYLYNQSRNDAVYNRICHWNKCNNSFNTQGAKV